MSNHDDRGGVPFAADLFLKSPSAHRKKGVANKITADIREGAIAGFARHGSNGRGEGGFAGFCFYLAKKHPKAAARIVEKLLPLQVNGTGLGGGPSINTVNIISVPTDTYLSAEDISRLHPPMQTIEQIPQAEHTPQEEPALAPSRDDLDSMTMDELARRAGVDVGPG